jgi:hypothetical protein
MHMSPECVANDSLDLSHGGSVHLQRNVVREYVRQRKIDYLWLAWHVIRCDRFKSALWEASQPNE